MLWYQHSLYSYSFTFRSGEDGFICYTVSGVDGAESTELVDGTMPFPRGHDRRRQQQHKQQQLSLVDGVACRRRRFRGTNHHERFVKPPTPPPPRTHAGAGAGFQMRAVGHWRKRKKRHRDVLRKVPGDRVLFEQHDFNLYTKTGFLAILYNPELPALRFVCMLQEEFLRYEIAWRFQEAITIRALADIEHYPALSKVTENMASRLMIAGKRGLIMFVPEVEPSHDRDGWPLPSTPTSSPRRADGFPAAELKKADFHRLYRGHRSNEKDFDLIFRVDEACLHGGIGRCLRFMVEQRPRGQAAKRLALARATAAAGGVGEGPGPGNVKLTFYYSTTLLQHILVALEQLGQARLKRDLARNLCKYMAIETGGVGTSRGMSELAFDLRRLRENPIMLDGLPGDGQKDLDTRLAATTTTVAVPHLMLLPIKNTRQGQGDDRGDGAPAISPRPKWGGAYLKVVTASEKVRSPRGTATLDLMNRQVRRAITPDSVALHRRLQDSKLAVVPPVGGRSVVRNNQTDRWRNKALLPAQRLASLPPTHSNPETRRNAMFYAAKRKREARRPQHSLLHTTASERGAWANRHPPKNSVWMGHDSRAPDGAAVHMEPREPAGATEPTSVACEHGAAEARERD